MAMRRGQRAVFAGVGAELMQNERNVQRYLSWQADLGSSRHHAGFIERAQAQLVPDQLAQIRPFPRIVA